MEAIDTWMKGESRDLEMGEYHVPFWNTFIKRTTSASLCDSTVLDFGCGCGGFLRCLYAQYAFKRGVGLDLANDSLAKARELKGDLPIEYLHASKHSELADTIDIAYSYEVIYLVSDLQDHARFIRRILKSKGIYFAATGCHTANPLWEKWQPLVVSQSNLPVPNYAPEDFVNAFLAEGFSVQGTKLGHTDFVPLDLHKDHFPLVEDVLRYYDEDILVFRFQKD